MAFVKVNDQELAELFVSEIVPIVTPAPISCVVTDVVETAWFAIAPTAFGTPVPFHPGLPLLLWPAFAPVQLEAKMASGALILLLPPLAKRKPVALSVK